MAYSGSFTYAVLLRNRLTEVHVMQGVGVFAMCHHYIGPQKYYYFYSFYSYAYTFYVQTPWQLHYTGSHSNPSSKQLLKAGEGGEKVRVDLSRGLLSSFFKAKGSQQPPVVVVFIGRLAFFSGEILFLSLCPIHVVTFTLISNLVTDYIQKRTGQVLLFSFEYNLSPNLISK